MEEDIIIDVIVDGRVLLPKEIPPDVSTEIEAALTDGHVPEEIIYEGVRYRWSVRPCVYP